jgi:hypothetical protein
MPFCSNCGTELQPNTGFCTKCGAPSPSAAPAQPIHSAVASPPLPPKPASFAKRHGCGAVAAGCGAMLFMVIAVAMCAGSNGGSTTQRTSSTRASSPSSSSSPTKSVAAPAIAVTATALVAEYQENAVAADKKYEGKRLRVTGTIEDFGKDVLDTAYIVLKGGSGDFNLHDVQCMFRENRESEIASLKKGQTVTIEGEVEGEALGFNVILKYCEVK